MSKEYLLKLETLLGIHLESIKLKTKKDLQYIITFKDLGTLICPFKTLTSQKRFITLFFVSFRKWLPVIAETKWQTLVDLWLSKLEFGRTPAKILVWNNLLLDYLSEFLKQDKSIYRFPNAIAFLLKDFLLFLRFEGLKIPRWQLCTFLLKHGFDNKVFRVSESTKRLWFIKV